MSATNPATRVRSFLEAPLAGLVLSCAIAAGITVGFASFHETRQVLDAALFYLALTVVAAAMWGYVIGLLIAGLCDVLVNYYFIPPVHTFTVSDTSDIFTLVLFLGVALFAAWMLARLRASVALLTAQRSEDGALLAVEHALARTAGPSETLRDLATAITQALGLSRCDILQGDKPWSVIASTHPSESPPSVEETRVVEEAWHTQAISGQIQLQRRHGLSTKAWGGFVIVPFPHDAGQPGALRFVGLIDLPPQSHPERVLRRIAAEASVAVHRAILSVRAQETETFQRADEFKGVLLSSVAHDLRSPLTAVKAAVGNLRDESVHWSQEDTREFLQTIEDQTDRVIAVVSDLLQMSRLDAGSVRIHSEPLNVAALLDDVAAAAASRRGRHALHVDADDELWVIGDHEFLMEAIGNLVENALRYSIAVGTIRLRAVGRGDQVWIEVQDEGPGIPREDLPHVFERLYRGVQARKTPGTGLGLAITKALVELCGGNVTVQSSYQGTTFTIALPKALAPA